MGEWLCFVFFQLKNPNFSLITACQNIFCILDVNFLNWLQIVYIATYFDAVIARFSFWSHEILLKYLLSCRKFLVNITSIYTSMTHIYIQTYSCGHLYWKVTFFLSCYWKFHVNWTSTGATSGAGLPTLPEHLSSIPGFSRVRVTRSLILCVMSCRSLFVLLSFFFWLFYLSFFDLWIPITPLVSSNSS